VVEAYVYSSCSSCRKTEQVLRELGRHVQRRELVREPLTREELENLLRRTGLSVQDLVSRRSRVYRAENLDAEPRSDAKMIALMARESTLIRRPVVGNGHVVVGHNAEKLRTVVSAGESGAESTSQNGAPG
jgi:regulatory protein spx